jgi:hypothetical protein
MVRLRIHERFHTSWPAYRVLGQFRAPSGAAFNKVLTNVEYARGKIGIESRSF